MSAEPPSAFIKYADFRNEGEQALGSVLAFLCCCDQNTGELLSWLLVSLM